MMPHKTAPAGKTAAPVIPAPRPTLWLALGAALLLSALWLGGLALWQLIGRLF